jgi:hypothetical protein
LNLEINSGDSGSFACRHRALLFLSTRFWNRPAVVT